MGFEKYNLQLVQNEFWFQKFLSIHHLYLFELLVNKSIEYAREKKIAKSLEDFPFNVLEIDEPASETKFFNLSETFPKYCSKHFLYCIPYTLYRIMSFC